MEQSKKLWFSENGNIKLTRKKLTNEIRRISALKAPLADKMQDIRFLIESYFKADSNEEFLNANMP